MFFNQYVNYHTKWPKVTQNVAMDIFSENFRNQLFSGCPVAPQGDSQRSLKANIKYISVIKPKCLCIGKRSTK